MDTHDHSGWSGNPQTNAGEAPADRPLIVRIENIDGCHLDVNMEGESATWCKADNESWTEPATARETALALRLVRAAKDLESEGYTGYAEDALLGPVALKHRLGFGRHPW